MRTGGGCRTVDREISRFPRKERLHMPGSSTTPGRPGARDSAPVRVAFRTRNSVGTRGLAFAAQWLAYALPYRRFIAVLADVNARLGADVGRYSFIVVDLHHLLLAGLPAHFECGLHTRAVTVFRDTLSEGFSHFVTSIAAPVASGWSVRRVGFAPTRKRRLSRRTGKADVDHGTALTASVVDDPERHLADQFCCDAQRCPLVGFVLDGQFA
jgi:hypothetical protein